MDLKCVIERATHVRVILFERERMGCDGTEWVVMKVERENDYGSVATGTQGGRESGFDSPTVCHMVGPLCIFYFYLILRA